jgi:uncharacterized membrane protein
VTDALSERLRRIDGWAWMFLLVAVFGALMFATTLPPYMGPDEPNHFKRAALTTYGQFAAERVTVAGAITAGGPVDPSVIPSARPLAPLMGKPSLKASVEVLKEAGRYRWTEPRPGNFRNTAVYAPIFYLPQSAAILVGRAARLPLTVTLGWARIANAAVCALIGFAALAIAGRRAKPLLYSVLLLPMSVFLYATATQDGVLLVVVALGCALISRAVEEERPMTQRESLLAASCFGLVALAKITYLPLTLILLAAPAERPRLSRAAVAAGVTVAVAWTVWMATAVAVPLSSPGSNPALQAAFLLDHPEVVPTVAVNTLGQFSNDYAAGFVGVLGWLDTPLPRVYRWAAWAILCVAFALCVGPAPSAARVRLAALAALILSAALLFAAVYIQWSAVGQLVVTGVQGRYLLPLALPLALVVSGGVSFLPLAAERAMSAVVVAFPVVSVIVAEFALLARYYGLP